MTAVTAVKDLTAAAIREAMLAAGGGRIRDAIQIGERALAAGGDEAALNALIGTLHCRSGNLDAGARHLKAAHSVRPDDAVIALNLITALAQLGRNREALDLITDELVKSDPSLQLLRARAFLAQQLEEFATAVKDYEQVVAAAPDDWESWNNLGNARRETGDFDGAVQALRRSVEINPQAAPSRFNYATALENAGRFDEAERELRGMARDFPGDEKPLRQLFTLLKRQYRDEEALEAIEQAVERAPKDLELILGLASHSLTQQRHALSEEAYRRAIAIDPKNVLGFLGIATVLDQTNRTEELSAFVKEAEDADLAAVQRRRDFPTRMTQRMQLFLQTNVLGRVLASGRTPGVAWPIRLMQRFPMLRRIPARLIGMGFRPEHVRG